MKTIIVYTRTSFTEIEKQKSEKKPDNNARGNTTDSNIAGDDLDDLLNGGHAISSSSDVYQRLRVRAQ